MPAISINNLTKKFGEFKAVDKLSFDVEKNHVVGFLGPNGAGKTTTLRMLVGLSKPTGGQMEIGGMQVIFGSSTTNSKIGYLPELPSMYHWMSGHEYLGLVADLFKMPVNEKSKKITELLKLVGLTAAKNKRISTYSGGMKQRLGIAQALVNNPEVIILDEPVSALDPIGRKEVLEVIEKLKNEHTVLFSTHILSDVDRICDDVVIINQGKLVVSSPLADLKAKHASPLIEVEFTADCKTVATAVAKEKWAKNVQHSGNKMKIWLVDDRVIENNTLLDFLSSKKLGILKFGLKLPEVEDLFIGLVEDKK